MSKERILLVFQEINQMYNNPNMYDGLSRMLDELIESSRNEAWECARKLFDSNFYEREVIFDSDNFHKVLFELSASEAMAKIKAYEEKQTDDEIKVGDEVIYNGNPHNGEVGLVIGLCEKWVEVRFKSRWNCVGVYRDTVTKTGRSFPQIAEVLKQMDGGDS